MFKEKSKYYQFIFILIGIGILDTGYLTWKNYVGQVVPCSASIFVDCGRVLQSRYSSVLGIPLTLLGLFHYIILAKLLIFLKSNESKYKLYGFYWIFFQSAFGSLFSIYLVYLQFVVIKSICLYCLISALISLLIFFLIWKGFKKPRKFVFVNTIAFLYKNGLRRILFLIDPETVHDFFVSIGEKLGNVKFIRAFLSDLMVNKDTRLIQEIHGIKFNNPVGLAAGFDYNARLTQTLHSLGFGYMSIGTVTNIPYKGNPKPRLGRLPKSKSLMVNKGFKTIGADKVSRNLAKLKLDMTVGISIGRSNSPALKTQKQSIEDIITSYKIFEQKKIKSSYYELNISCPNLIHSINISFYPSNNLDDLLVQIDKLKLSKPLFIKMPISESDKDTLAMLKIIAKHNVAGVVFGNLMKDRKNKSLDKNEVDKFNNGNFSGKPTFARSNQLIELAYKNFKNRFVIIGCGGVFNGHDAYEKIRRGANLIQLVTGMIYEGPQIAAKINFDLLDIIEKKGYKNISEAVGSKFSR